jgi:hypothetical protein
MKSKEWRIFPDSKWEVNCLGDDFVFSLGGKEG